MLGRHTRCLGSTAAVFDPATLTLAGWWRSSYAASPWVGTASAGGSGSRDLTEATNPPAAGAAVNGLTPADFDGSNDMLGSATAFTTWLPTAAYFYWVLFDADAVGANAFAAAYDNPQLFADTGGFIGAGLTSSGGNKVQVWNFDASTKGNEHAISLATPNLLCARYDGTDIRSKLNSGSVLTAASGAYDSAAGTLRVGRNYTAAFYNGRILDMGFMASAGTDANFDDIKAYVNDRYALAL